MRATLSNSVRPRLGQAQLNLGHGPNTIIRRTTITPLRQTLTACDAFTILLAPVFTAAFVVDIVQKDKRRREWEQKIARVQADTEVLRERGLRSWNILQSRSVQAGTLRQRRTYSTTINASNVLVAMSEAEQEVQEKQDDQLPSITDLHKYENLLATKLGLQLLLYMSTGRSPSPKLSMEGRSDELVELDSLESLLNRLEAVNKGLNELEQRLPSKEADFNFENTGGALDEEISSLTWQCRTGQIPIADLIYGYTRAVVHSRTGPALKTYRNLTETFSTLDADVLTSISLFPYFKTRQVLSDRSIVSIIYQYGKVKDSRRLEQFLQRLVQNDRGFRIANEWEVVVVNGVRVPAPVNRRPRILDMLLRTALQGDQPHKAKAWATLLMQQGISTGRMAALFNNFLTYCARQVNWTYGELWLQSAIAWAALVAQSSPWMLSKLIYRMLDLCISCGKMKTYNDLLAAAVTARIDVPLIDGTRPDAFADQARQVFQDWKNRAKQSESSSFATSHIVEAATIFQQEMAKIDSAITAFIGVTEIRKIKSLMVDIESRNQAILPTSSIAQDSSTFDSSSWNTIDQLGPPSRLLAANIVERPLQQSQDTVTYRPDIEYTQLSDTNDFGSIMFEFDTEMKPERSNTAEHGFKYWNQGSDFAERSTQFQREVQMLKAKNSHLAAQLETSSEKERELTKLIEQLKTQLTSAGRKSLETVFLEKENFNIRFEMRELSTRYQAALNEKERMQEEVRTARVDLKRLETRLAADMDALYKENVRLQERLSQESASIDQRMQASRAREGNLQKILLRNEERVRLLRTEIARLQSTNAEGHAKSESIETSSLKDEHVQDTGAKSERRKFSLHSLGRSGHQLTS